MPMVTALTMSWMTISEKQKMPALWQAFQSVEKVNFTEGVYQFALHQSLPCVKGGGSPQGDSEGLRSKKYRIPIGFRRNPNIVLRQSLSHAVRVTAPFTQGSLGRRKRHRVYRQPEMPALWQAFLLALCSEMAGEKADQTHAKVFRNEKVVRTAYIHKGCDENTENRHTWQEIELTRQSQQTGEIGSSTNS